MQISRFSCSFPLDFRSLLILYKHARQRRRAEYEKKKKHNNRNNNSDISIESKKNVNTQCSEFVQNV